MRLDRARNAVTVSDRYALRESNGKLEMTMMTASAARHDAAGAILLAGGEKIAIAGTAAPAIRTEEIAITDGRLRSSWGTRLYRTVLTWTGAPAEGELKLEITSE